MLEYAVLANEKTLHKTRKCGECGNIYCYKCEHICKGHECGDGEADIYIEVDSRTYIFYCSAQCAGDIGG